MKAVKIDLLAISIAIAMGLLAAGAVFSVYAIADQFIFTTLGAPGL